MVGAHEISGANTMTNLEPAVVGAVLLANIGSMVTMLKAANIPIVIGNMAPCPEINGYRFDIALGENSVTSGSPT